MSPLSVGSRIRLSRRGRGSLSGPPESLVQGERSKFTADECPIGASVEG